MSIYSKSNRQSIRLKHYDYSAEGCYFITICTKNGKNMFGKIVGAGLASAQNNIKLSIIGKIVNEQWNNIINYQKNIELDQHIIMPNHIHGIIIINKRAEASPAPTLSKMICSFKSKCTNEYMFHIKQNNLNVSCKLWQRSFYDHIIRNEESLHKIREYIINNPVNWDKDEYSNQL
ncbi:MAG: transposase [Candidatus Zapsychrus exili]|nr:transposase [Candidatus Zapsychrus exili]